MWPDRGRSYPSTSGSSFCAAQQIWMPIDRSGSKPEVTALQNARLLLLQKRTYLSKRLAAAVPTCVNLAPSTHVDRDAQGTWGSLSNRLQKTASCMLHASTVALGPVVAKSEQQICKELTKETYTKAPQPNLSCGRHCLWPGNRRRPPTPAWRSTKSIAGASAARDNALLSRGSRTVRNWLQSPSPRLALGGWNLHLKLARLLIATLHWLSRC